MASSLYSNDDRDDPADSCSCIHVSFHEQAAKTPNAVCLIADAAENDGNDNPDPSSVAAAVSSYTYTYREVQLRVLQLAQELKKAGAETNKVVAIFMEPSADFVISMLAILSAGAAYVPLELSYPVVMLQRVLNDAEPVAVLTHLDKRAMLPATDSTLICLDDAEHHINLQHQEEANTNNTSARSIQQLLAVYQSWKQPTLDDLAFIVYSSGTTGQPKGIANPHRAPALSYRWRFHEISDYQPGDRVACNVFFVWEALRPIMRGAAVVPVPASVIFDAERLSEFLQRHQVTEMLFTPSLLENVLNLMTTTTTTTTTTKTSTENNNSSSQEHESSLLSQRLSALRTIFLNGEVVPVALRARCYQTLPHVRFINLYSISECHEVGAVDLKDINLQLSTKFCPIGPPCSVSPAYVLDETEQPVAPGDAGELYVGGDMLAVGYLNLPELTQTRFVPDPFRGGRMYRTGDRARMLPNGQLEILGRCDFMVKIRGYSIVLGAVEAALVECVALSSCVVVADGEEGEEKHLVAYLVRAPVYKTNDRLSNFSVDQRTGACPEIRRAVDGVLPHYMVPSVYIELQSLPVNAVGAKLDRKALQAQTADRRAMLRSLQFSSATHTVAVGSHAVTGDRWKRLAKYLRVPPDSPLEEVEDAMATLWEVVLGRDPGTMIADSDFHENGGHSLSAARLVSLINKVFASHLTAVKIMQGPTTIRTCSEQVVASWTASNSSRGSSRKVVGEKINGAANGGTSAAEEKRILQQVRNDAKLPDDVVPKARGSARGLDGSKTILLTGATGFLGAHCLAELLRKYSSATVMCLVRSPDRDTIQKNLERYSLWDEGFASRILVMKGNLSLPQFGLDRATLDQTASVVDAVVHCGAAVSLTAPYAMLANTNVRGTLEVIRLACACKEGTPLVYVSSNGIFPRDKGADEVFLENDDVFCLPDRLGAMDGYGLSKWAAEQLVIAAHKRGLPTMCVRFGNIGWHSGTGIGNALDFQGMMINGSRRLGYRPRIDGWLMEVTPVNFAASTLVALADKPGYVQDGAIFNCVQSEFVDAERVFEWIAETDGATLPALSFEEWASKVTEVSDDNTELAALKAFVMGIAEGEEFFSKLAFLDCSKFDAAVSKLEIPLTRLSGSSEVAHYYRTFLLANGGLFVSSTSGITTKPVAVDPAVTGQTVGPLAGKVAIVTGASSGIGRATVLALVQAGAHVAMGARRLAELEKTQMEVAAACPGSASKTLCVRCDVTKREDVTALVKAAESSLGPCDILVNCAGVMYFTLMKNVMFKDWDTTIDVNCKGTMYGIGTVLPGMLQRGTGHIVNITSDAGRKAFPGLAVYSGSKFMVEAVSQALRAETASTGLRVTCIQPGNVETPLLSMSTDPEGLTEYGTPTGAKVLEPKDIGNAVVYALSQPEWCAVNEILVEPREEPA